MNRNFQVRSSIEIELDGKTIDLHNDFLLDSFAYLAGEGRVVFTWSSRDNLAKQHMLIFDGVTRLLTGGMDPEMPREEDRTVSFIGFLHPDDVSVMDGFLPEGLSKSNYDLIVGLEGGLSIKVAAHEALFV